jgi:hypothetical protein
MPDIEDLGTVELRRTFPALSSLLRAIFYPTWEMDYRDASEAFDDAVEGFSVQSATDVRAEINSVLITQYRPGRCGCVGSHPQAERQRRPDGPHRIGRAGIPQENRERSRKLRVPAVGLATSVSAAVTTTACVRSRGPAGDRTRRTAV